jgi:hypothetical protein
MGCDEHMFIEARTETGAWEAVDPPEIPATVEKWSGEWFDHWGYKRDRYEDVEGGAMAWGFGRCYSSYARFAGVRAYGGPSTPIAEGRGLPADVTTEVRACRDSDDSDAHSLTWATLSELDAAAASQEGLTERLDDLSLEMRRVATERGVSADYVRVVVWFDN